MKRKQLARIDLSNPDKPTFVFNAGNKAFLSDIKEFKDGTKVWVIIEKYHAQRSLSQNSLQHVWYTIIADEIGVEMGEAKDLLKRKFLTVVLTDKHGNEIHDENGELQFKIRDTSDLNKVETMDYMDKIYRWALDFLNVTLPLPEQQQEIPIDYPTLNRENI